MLNSELLRITHCQKKIQPDGSVKVVFYGPYMMLGPLTYENEEAFREAIKQASSDSQTPIPQYLLDAEEEFKKDDQQPA